MNILINCSNLKIGGGMQVAHSFIYEIKKGYEEHKFIVVLSSNLYKQLKVEEFPENFIFHKYDVKYSLLNVLFSKNKKLESIVMKFSIDRVFTVFGPAYWKPKVTHICGYARPHYIYKESPYFKEIGVKGRFLNFFRENFNLYHFKNNNRVIITENEDVSKRLSQRINNKIYTVTNYYNQIFDKKEDWGDVYLEDFEGVKLLTVTANYPHKNLSCIKKVIPYLRKSYPKFKFKFYLTFEEKEFFLNKNDILLNNIEFIGKQKISDCPELYKKCDFLFLPTLLECFSASYCEAMKMKKPILTSNLSFAKGICNDAAAYFDPVDIKSIGDTIYNVAMNQEKQKDLIKKGTKRLLSFDNSKQRAEKYINIILKE